MGTTREHACEQGELAPEQLALDLPPPPMRDAPKIILSESNRNAAAFATRPELWPSPVACLVGEKGCGKTRIAQACFLGATPLSASDLSADASAVSGSESGSAGRFWFDDLDRAHRCAREAGGDQLARLESGLFHLINELAVGGGRLLTAAQEPPALWSVRLPDLRTRLSTALLLRIEPPEDSLLEAFLERRLQERGLATGAGVVSYLLQRLERSFGAIDSAVATLDKAGLKEKRRITRDLAARTLGL